MVANRRLFTTFANECKLLYTAMKGSLKYLLITICLFFTLVGFAQTPTHVWRSIHKVKKHETIFAIAKDYGVTIEELLDANPEMKKSGYELKKGTWVFVPYVKKGDKDAADKKQGREKLQAVKERPVLHNVIKVGFMLPIHRENSEGERMVEYYQGMRLALDSLAKQGVNAELYAWNVAKDSSIVKVLSDPRAYTLDVIFGPLYSEQLPALSEFCKTHNIKLFVPFSIEGDEVKTNPEILQVYQTPNELNKKMVLSFLERFQKSSHIVFVDCNESSDGKFVFTQALRQHLDASRTRYSLTNLNTPLSSFAKQFSTKQPNVVVLNTAKSPQLNRAFAKLDSLKQSNSKIAISMYGYNEWFMYEKYDLANFYKYNVYIPTTYYYNAVSDRNKAFERDFNARWGVALMPQWLPRIGLMGYDHTMYAIEGLSKYGKEFVGSEDQSTYRALQSPLKFKQVGVGGGYVNSVFQLIHFRPDQKLESMTY